MKKLVAAIAALLSLSSGQTRAADKVDFVKQIRPILEQTCIKCHGPDKQKGKLRLDSKEAAMKGGEDGAVIVAGKADKSDLYRRVILSKDDDDVMPAKGDPLTKEQTDAIRDWINQGAEWPESAAVLSVASAQAGAAGKIEFAKQIWPILEHNCIKCHGPDKQKGKLRLDSKEAAMKGGKDGVVIEPDKADKSELYRRVTLPKGDDDIMPAEGDPLTREQTDLIRKWINEGAEWPENALASVKETEPTDPLAGLPKDFKPGANEAKAAARFAQLGVDVRPIAMNVHWTEANFRPQGANVNDAAIAPLKDMTSLTDLNLANTKITDAGLAAIEGLTYLTRLHLELTPITDAGLAHLKNLTNLNYLNLYGTAVTDAGLGSLKGLQNLKHLYVWQTKVTEDGAKKLQAALPKLEISTGAELTAAVKKEDDATKEEKKDDKKEEKK